MTCLACLDSFRVGDTSLRYWLQCGCLRLNSSIVSIAAIARSTNMRPLSIPIHTAVTGPVHVGNKVTHSTHVLMKYRGLIYCNACGYVATGQMRKLATPCDLPRPTNVAGDKVLASIRRADLPKSLAMKEWPEP